MAQCKLDTRIYTYCILAQRKAVFACVGYSALLCTTAIGSETRFDLFSALCGFVFCSRSARGARAELHAPKAPKSKAEMEAEAAAEELMAKHREVNRSCRVRASSTVMPSVFPPRVAYGYEQMSACLQAVVTPPVIYFFILILRHWIKIKFKLVAFACIVCDLQARGASLVERHKVDPAKAKKAAGGKEGGKKTFSWSREEDFEQRRKFTPQVKLWLSVCGRHLVKAA